MTITGGIGGNWTNAGDSVITGGIGGATALPGDSINKTSRDPLATSPVAAQIGSPVSDKLSAIDAAIFYFGVQAREDERRAVIEWMQRTAMCLSNPRDIEYITGLVNEVPRMPPVPMSAATERKLQELRALIAALVKPDPPAPARET